MRNDRWPSIAFGDLLEQPLRSGINAPSRTRGYGVKLVNMGELFLYDRIGDVPMERAPLPGHDPDRYLLREGDLLFARQSLKLEGAGRCIYTLAAEEERTWEGHIIRARLDGELADSRFYYYWFRSPPGRAAVGSIVEQVAAAGVRGSDLARLVVPRPTVDEQRRIADILWSLDDKIASNARMICTAKSVLESESAAAKASAERTVRVRELVISQSARLKNPPLSTSYVGLEHIDRFGVVVRRRGSASESKTATKMFERGDLLFGRIRPYFGKVAVAPFAGVCAQSIEVLRPAQAEYRAAAVVELSSQRLIEEATARSTGTTMPQVKWEAMADVELTVPSGPALIDFNHAALPLLERIMLAAEESHVLGELRDALLQDLMCGRIKTKPNHGQSEGVAG